MELKTLKDYTQWLVECVAIVMAGLWLINQSPIARDDTDEPGWFGERSGMSPMTDRLTGCQYLRTSSGGITPRLDAAGRQIGCK